MTPGISLGRLQRLAGKIRCENPGIGQRPSSRHSQTAGTRADVDDGGALASRQTTNHFVNQQFRFRPRDQYGRINLELQAAELLSPQDVLEWFPRNAAGQIGIDLRHLLTRQQTCAVEKQA